MYRKASRTLWKGFFVSLAGFFLYILSIYFNLFNLYGGMPDLRDLENPKNEIASELYTADGKLLGKYFRENRTPVSYENLSPALINTLKATEDIRFESHSGIDFKGTMAIVPSLLIGKKRGSSTITQQLAKNLFKTRKASEMQGHLSKWPLIGVVSNKFKEWILAIRLERSYTKREIMTMYFNTVDFGHNAFGINVAAQTFFGKYPEEINYTEAAMLIGLLKAPSTYSPVSHPDNALRRRNTVLEQLEKYGYITEKQYDSLKVHPVDISKYQMEDHNSGLATYFRNVVGNYLRGFCAERGLDLYGDGLKVYTTIDSRMQVYAEEAVHTHMKDTQKKFFKSWSGRKPWRAENGGEIPNYLQEAIKKSDHYKLLKEIHQGDSAKIYKILNTKRKMKIFSWETPTLEKDTVMSAMDSLSYYKHFLHAGMMAMDPKNGHIKAWVGGINHKYFKYDHVKQGKRQPGSTVKPFIYAKAIELGKHPCDVEEDAPITFNNPEAIPEQRIWTPKNSDGHPSMQKMTLRQAMARSINTVAAKMIMHLGGGEPSGISGAMKVRDFMYTLGFEGPIDAVPSICLGTSDASVYEMVGAYGAFVNKGIWTEPIFITRIEDSNGKVIQDLIPKKKEAMNEDIAYTMVYMLMGGLQERGGTSAGLFKYDFINANEVGGKTGTTSNNSDAWYMGITKDFVVGVWSGGDERAIHFASTADGQGSKQAMPAYGLFMEKVYKDPSLGIQKGRFTRPAKFDKVLDCKQYGTDIPGDSTAYDIYTPATDPDDAP